MAVPVTPRTSGTLQPPGNEAPVAADGQLNLSWSAHFQDVASKLNNARTGTTTNDNAAAGQIGEYISGTATGVTLSNGVTVNITSIALTAGDWDVSGNVAFTPAPTTHPVTLGASCSSTSGAFGSLVTLIETAFTVGQPTSFDAGGVTRFSLAAPATVYLVAVAFFSTAGMTAAGFLAGRRMR